MLEMILPSNAGVKEGREGTEGVKEIRGGNFVSHFRSQTAVAHGGDLSHEHPG